MFSPREETFCVYGYKADENLPAGSRWKSPLYMPRVASRFLLEVKSIKVERLQDISEEDARAEGGGGIEPGEVFFNFGNLWDSINAKRGYSWEMNPWVYVIEFMRVK
ncbi:hypothetical protein FACS1894137_19510 [Spirochaetia bacterium]|nr:hypothetical protein FACS1894137_19510 [Spirochaetia bacterium]